MSNANFRPEYFSVGGIFIDDIVYPDGRTKMEILGGGTIHAAAGMSIWDVRPGVMVTVGNNLPEKIRIRLERDFDTQGFYSVDMPQARAWQLFEWDGKRTEIYRVKDINPYIYKPTLADMPESYRDAKGIHLLQGAHVLKEWRDHFPDRVIFWEPLQQYMIPENAAEFRASLSIPDMVSPNLLETTLIYGEKEPEELIKAMLDDGAKVVILRMGEQGSLIADQSGKLLEIPAVSVPEVIDVTGAGNTYCGAFLVGYLETGELRQAGYYGAVAASFTLEQVGVVDPPMDKVRIRQDRLNWLMQKYSST